MLNGETIAFSKSERLLDGQHRLTACASLALDSGIHARMTALKIITSNNAYLLWLINTFTVYLTIGESQKAKAFPD